MKVLYFLFALTLFSAQSLKAQDDVISLFEGSKVIHDDDLGYETHYYLTGPTSHKSVDGKIRRQFCELPEDISPYEVIKNYEQAIKSKKGTVIHISREANTYKDKTTGEIIRYMYELFVKGRKPHNEFAYYSIRSAKDYIAGKVSTPENEIYFSIAAVAAGKKTHYTLVTILAESMNMGNVTLDVLTEGIDKAGKIAIYNIYFDTNKSEVKEESASALAVIANYLKSNPNRKFIVVGHTDNTGNFDSNIKLSNDRAEAVFEKLVADHGVARTQLTTYGIGSTSPVMTNATDEGKAKNRRVELVEF
jgi:OmpA-OmpF porin, OOP family